jgi:hypothetical protein
MPRPDDGTPPPTDASDAPRPLAPGVLSEAVPLRDALEGIGELWRLPKRPSAAASAGAEPAGEHTSIADATPARLATAAAAALSRAPFAVPAWLWAVGVAGATWFTWWTLQPAALVRDAMPAALRTTWRTEHPDYARSALVITDSTLIIMTVDAGAPGPTRPIQQQHAITGLRTTVRGDTTDFTLTYDVEGDPVELQARVVGGAAPRLTFSRPEGLTWHPESSLR